MSQRGWNAFIPSISHILKGVGHLPTLPILFQPLHLQRLDPFSGPQLCHHANSMTTDKYSR